MEMFVTEEPEDDRSSLQSWYGDPQYDEGDTNGWESEYYGAASGESPEDPVEFVPEVEHPGVFREDDRVPERRSARPLSASD
ncbi:hypothetical protein [Halalkalicoccus tibetensis]